ncbi:MAG: hypothetical protein EAZ79_09390 [Oscillatoriales cyanobacterium]|nr:MAG: hypothetical protein EAZ79_09390 [Oscillatoriales cyanobacterium]
MKGRIRRFQLHKSYHLRFAMGMTDDIRIWSLPAVALFFETNVTIIRESEVFVSGLPASINLDF